MNGATAGDDIGLGMFKIIGNESYHPTKLGHALIAKTIDEATQNLTSPMPTPTPFSQPVFSDSIDLLQAVPKTNDTLNVIKYDDTVFTDSLLQRGDTSQASALGANLQLQPGSSYAIVIHSEPRTLVTGTVNPDGNIVTGYTIPADMPAGLHTLHLYAKNMAGETVDVPHIVYVAASPDDYDGDGVPNAANMCLIFPLSGVDYDEDSIDDSCDPDITQQPSHPVTPESGDTSNNQNPATPPEPSTGDDSSPDTTSGAGTTPPADGNPTSPESSGNGSITPPEENQQATPPAAEDPTSATPNDTTQATTGVTNPSGASTGMAVAAPASLTSGQPSTQTPVLQTQPTIVAAASFSSSLPQQPTTERSEPSLYPQTNTEILPTIASQSHVLHAATPTPPQSTTRATDTRQLTTIWLLATAVMACGSVTAILLKSKHKSIR
jgi:hypothetical protein